MNNSEYNSIQINDTLFRDDRDPVKVTSKHPSGYYVTDLWYNEDIQDYEPHGKEYLLTAREVMTFRLA